MSARGGGGPWLALAAVLALPGGAAAEDDQTRALRDLFAKDPTAGFQVAARLFEEPRRNDDLHGMVELVRAVGPEATRCLYAPVLDEMIDAALARARDGGKWELLGELYLTRARICRATSMDPRTPGANDYWRERRCLVFAADALERVGRVPEDLARQAEEARPLLRDRLAAQVAADFGALPPGYREAVVEMRRADADGRDAEAVARAERALRMIAEDEDAARVNLMLSLTAPVARLRGGEKLLPLLEDAARPQEPDSFAAVMTALAYASALGWSGGNDALRDCFYRACHELDPARVPTAGLAMVPFAVKLGAFGRREEALSVVRSWLDFDSRALELVPRPRDLVRYRPYYPEVVFSYTPADLRDGIAAFWCRLALFRQEDFPDEPLCRYPLFRSDVLPSARLESLTAALSDLVRRAPMGQQEAAEREVGRRLYEVAPQFARVEDRAQALVEAARHLELGGEKDLAAQARSLATDLVQGDPKARLRCALAQAQAAAGESQWDEVAQRLQPALVDGQPEALPACLEARLLLAQALRRLGRAADAQAQIDRARLLLGELRLPPGERARHLVALASGSSQPEQQAQLLDQARQAAGEAGLEIMQAGIAEQLAQLALDGGDLPTARRALLDIVKQEEARRVRLAFDPLLRQQWFAGSLGPYRRLLRVAALQRDARLALDCSEKLRSRALTDQLAWRKVDLVLYLPPDLRTRLNDLREKRRQVYGWMQSLAGGGATPQGSEAAEETPADRDAARLKSALDALAEEETALESAIRDALPVYKRASQTGLPPPEELVRLASRDPALAVLEYSVSDAGLVLVGLRAGKAPRVLLLPEKDEALWQRIARLRQALWERKDTAVAQAGDLYRSLVAPAEDLLSGAQRLWIVAEGAVQLIPFAALPGRDGKYLAERMAVAYAPSLSLAVSRRVAPPGEADLSALVVAAPETGAAGSAGDRGMYMPIRGMYMLVRGAYIPIRGEGGVSTALTEMATMPLPGARAEGDSVARAFAGAELLSGAEATKLRLLQEGSRCEVLHIATHGYADPEVPEFSGLLLAGTGGKRYEVLTAQEVYLWPLRARLVTLSACQTGLGKNVEGEGLLGLTRAFIYAGAQDVLCSLWPVSDESTAKLMATFYAALRKGAAVEDALREAQLQLLQDPATRHPFYWAAFIPVRGPQ